MHAIRDYLISECSLLDDNLMVNVDYLAESMSYSIDTLPCDPLVKKYTDGGKQKQYQFALMSKEVYDLDSRINIDNSGFFQSFEDWIEEKDKYGPLPILGEGQQAIGLEVLNKGYLYDAEGELANYRIECRLIYYQED